MSPQQPPDLTLSAITVFTGMGLVILTHLVRPLPETASPLVVLIAGSLPNFGAGLGLPFVAAAIPRMLRQARTAPITAKALSRPAIEPEDESPG
ncbi:MAG: hypothetical protein K6U03_11520 [Firmicutes bacterium]|nr:hypothetical protein [Bacillota bacterium]